MKINIRLEGMGVLSKRLCEKSKDDFIAVCRQTTIVLRRNAALVTPVKTGKLRNSIRTEMPVSDKDGEVGYTREYAPHVEYGHRMKNSGWVNGQYYLKKAVDQTRPEFKRLLYEELKK